jgi:acetyl-CoA carboxylase biotin carboxyl carrier protein
LDIKELKEILQILDEREIVEFELEEGGRRLRIRKAGAAPPPPAPAIAAPVVPAIPRDRRSTPVASAPPDAAAPALAEAKEKESDEGLTIVKSPIVGTFYRSPDPNAAPFVSVGDHVKVGQVLCIVEAMKLMNEIEAEIAGQIVKIHPENGQPIQYGEPLFTLRPSK